MINWRMDLEKICKRIKYDELLANHTSFRIGGPALAFVEVSDRHEIQKLAQESRNWGLSIVILGRGTNVLFEDSGYDGIIVKLAGEFKKIRFEENFVIAGTGVSLNKLSNECAKSGLSGLEFAYGIPGSVGGALIMNAGAHGNSISDVVRQIELIEENGKSTIISGEEAGFGYRKSELNRYFCVVEAKLKLEPKASTEIKDRMRELYSVRKNSQPLRELSAGCIFKNPPNDSAGRLIDSCGLKGKRIGDAKVSSKHANFIINKGSAKASDIYELIDLVKTEVKKRKGVELELELEIL